MKKIFALVLSVLLVMSVLSVGFAENKTITLPNVSGLAQSDGSVVYNVYQVLTGTYDSTDGKLGDVHWGSSTAKSGQAATKDELDTISALADNKASTATAIKAYCTGDAFAANKAPGSTVSVPDGYYLIEEVITKPAEGVETSLYVVQVVGADVAITRKANTTTSDKTVDDVNDSDASDTTANAEGQTSADYDIGDAVPYHVTATISDSVANYNPYKIILEDVLEAGRFDGITLDKATITLDGAAIAETTDYTVSTTWNSEPSASGFKVTYVFTPKAGKDLSSLAGKTIAIDFTATLGEGAQIGGDGNSNTFKVKYSNNPNSDDMGDTVDKDVTVFTFKIIVNKVDENEYPLANAGFTLYKVTKAIAEAGVTGADAQEKNAAWAAVNHIKVWTDAAAANKTTFNFEGLDDGYYVLCETTTPSGYNTINPQLFKVEATHTKTEITALTGTKLNSGDTITFTPDTAEGSLTADIQNQSGHTLPETGGIGTTLFYIGGSILVLAAVVLLITKRRMNAND